MKRAKRTPLRQRLAERLELTLDIRSDAANLPSTADLQRWARAALQADVQKAQISLLLVESEEGRALNRDYRGKDYATNVLSFALNEGETLPGMPLFGDLVLCVPVVEREASEQDTPLAAHYAHLTVHGMLHLQGYDHEDDDEAEVMEALETAILAKLGYPDPYAAEKT
ncbi:rRNA maturation RNase YbeY [Pseudogulbenkiania subflava]|uniref:Endoribonuclease YbeY n=1 Tax=Pseudogulbenkiania subflava DSM 22618 TaxID=1123014 RepID=A0A1Y6CCH0_9NEIS|nr:rRNA maturation RNase YbeY [Pseudogulbenkiania subflava]SMF54773.1 probable rRNA maturation factor [Pseudogulbenkiania subflava DSM 22618]